MDDFNPRHREGDDDSSGRPAKRGTDFNPRHREGDDKKGQRGS